MDLLIALGAAYNTYVNAMSFGEESKQYQRMSDLFFKGEKLISTGIKQNNWKHVKELILELGKEALTENGDWLLTKRSRPIELPTG